MKEAGQKGTDIVKALIENSATFASKTSFSQVTLPYCRVMRTSDPPDQCSHLSCQISRGCSLCLSNPKAI